MKINALLASLALAALPAMSYAACTRTEVTGTWVIYSGSNPSVRCVLAMPSTGTAISTTSSCFQPGVGIAPLRGNLTLLSNCHVTGTTRTGTAPIVNVDAWISKGKDSISGMTWMSGVVNSSTSFSGVKR